MKNIENFYKELKFCSKKIDQLDVWNQYDWSENGYENCIIMSELALEISKWDLKVEYDQLCNLFEIIEDGFIYYDTVTSSVLTTDFLVTIMEIENKLIRDELKKMMKTETQNRYVNMLQFYTES